MQKNAGVFQIVAVVTLIAVGLACSTTPPPQTVVALPQTVTAVTQSVTPLPQTATPTTTPVGGDELVLEGSFRVEGDSGVGIGWQPRFFNIEGKPPMLYVKDNSQYIRWDNGGVGLVGIEQTVWPPANDKSEACVLNFVVNDMGSSAIVSTGIVVAVTPSGYNAARLGQNVLEVYQPGVVETQFVLDPERPYFNLFIGVRKTASDERFIYAVFNISVHCDTVYGE